VLFAVAAWSTACGPGKASDSSETEPLTAPAPAAPAEPVSARQRIVVLGDSLTAGLGIDRDQAYPARLEQLLKDAGHDYEVINAGVSGDTTAGGLRRLDWALEGNVRVLIVALGGNDGLRGLSIEEMKRNLTEIIMRAQQKDIKVLLAGMEALPNLGETYTLEFRQAFRELAKEHQVQFVPFLLTGVAGQAKLNQADGIHPNAEGARLIAEGLWPTLRAMVEEAGRAQHDSRPARTAGAGGK
jgi:acyl-CoA thioesterase-1